LAGSRCNPLCCNKSVFCSTSLRIGTNNDRCGWTNPAYRTRRGNWLSYLVLSEQKEIDKQLRLLSDRERYGRIFAGWNSPPWSRPGSSSWAGWSYWPTDPGPGPDRPLPRAPYRGGFRNGHAVRGRCRYRGRARCSSG
jgi:hypothetical protein